MNLSWNKAQQNNTNIVREHPRNIPIRNVILKHFRTLGDDAATASSFTEPTICVFRRDRSVGDMVVRSRLDSVRRRE